MTKWSRHLFPCKWARRTFEMSEENFYMLLNLKILELNQVLFITFKRMFKSVDWWVIFVQYSAIKNRRRCSTVFILHLLLYWSTIPPACLLAMHQHLRSDVAIHDAMIQPNAQRKWAVTLTNSCQEGEDAPFSSRRRPVSLHTHRDLKLQSDFIHSHASDWQWKHVLSPAILHQWEILWW